MTSRIKWWSESVVLLVASVYSTRSLRRVTSTSSCTSWKEHNSLTEDLEYDTFWTFTLGLCTCHTRWMTKRLHDFMIWPRHGNDSSWYKSGKVDMEHRNGMHPTEAILKGRTPEENNIQLITDVAPVRNWSIQTLTCPLLYVYTIIHTFEFGLWKSVGMKWGSLTEGGLWVEAGTAALWLWAALSPMTRLRAPRLDF